MRENFLRIPAYNQNYFLINNIYKNKLDKFNAKQLRNRFINTKESQVATV